MSLINKKPYYQKTFGAFRVKIYHSSRSIRDCYMTLDVPHTGEYHRIQANDRFYGLCFNCAAKHDDKALKSAIDVYLAVNALLFASQENVDAFIGVLNSISEGLFKKAEENAAKTTEEQEQADQALMSEAVEYTNISKTERKKRREELREAARDIIEGYDEQGNNR